MAGLDWESFSVFPTFYDNRFLTVGPSGDRVSFSVQQRRATILAAMFASEYGKRQRPGVEIAVVGGGLAGVTLFGLLHSLGFSRAHLFESDSELLSLQREAPHRLAHPSYNTWPSFDDFESTTRNLPMFRWGAGPVDYVVEQIDSQFSDFLNLNPIAKSQIHRSHEVEEVIEIRGKMEVSKVQLKFAKGRTSNFKADYVVATMGFGAELSVSNTDRYWQEDRLEVRKKNIRKGIKNNFFIAGNGDGALIDAARVAYKGDTSDVAVFQDLHLSAIFGLRSKAHKTPAKSFKVARNLLSKSQTKSVAENSISRIEKKLKNNATEDGALEAMDGYLQTPALQKETDRLQGLICKDCSASLRIIGNRDNLLVPGAAPINKFIACQILKQGGQVTKGHLMLKSKDGSTILAPHTGGVGDYTIQDNARSVKQHDADLNDPNTKVLCRIGAKPKVTLVCRGSDTDEFRNHFSDLGNRQEFDGVADPNALNAVESVSQELGTPTAYDMEPLARNHIDQWFGDSFSLFVAPAEGDMAAHYFIEHSDDVDPEHFAKKLGGFDHHLFGIPVYFKKVSNVGNRFVIRPTRRSTAA